MEIRSSAPPAGSLLFRSVFAFNPDDTSDRHLCSSQTRSADQTVDTSTGFLPWALALLVNAHVTIDTQAHDSSHGRWHYWLMHMLQLTHEHRNSPMGVDTIG